MRLRRRRSPLREEETQCEEETPLALFDRMVEAQRVDQMGWLFDQVWEALSMSWDDAMSSTRERRVSVAFAMTHLACLARAAGIPPERVELTWTLWEMSAKARAAEDGQESRVTEPGDLRVPVNPSKKEDV